MNKIYIIYHNNCMDGFGAAFAAWLKYKDQAIYIPADYNKPMPPVESDCEVYIMDVSFSRPEMIELQARSKKLVVLDHHETAKDNLAGLDFCIFDMKKSGARLAWEYFHGTEDIPYYIKYIEDRDLWKWRLKNSLAINTGIAALPFDFKVWAERLPKKVKLLNAGTAVLEYQTKLVNQANLDINLVTFLGHENIPCVNTSNLQSDICEMLSQKHQTAFSLCYHIRPGGKVKWSIRSLPARDYNVRELAEKFGGGGHRNASGFMTDRDFLDQVLKTVKG